MMTRVAGIVLYFRAGRDKLTNSVEACLNQSQGFDELIVVDNASCDGVAQAIACEFPQVKVIVMPSNLGYAGGMNSGYMELSQAPDVCFFITHEVIMERACVQSLVHELIDGAVLVGPRLRLPNGRVWSEGGLTTRLGKPVNAKHPTSDVSWLDGAVLAVNATLFRSIGGFDERFFLYWEDVDLGYRMGELGAVKCVPQVEAIQDTSEAPPFLMARGRVLMWRLHRKPLLLAASLVELLATGTSRVIVRHNRSSVVALRYTLLGCIAGLTVGQESDKALSHPESKLRRKP